MLQAGNAVLGRRRQSQGGSEEGRFLPAHGSAFGDPAVKVESALPCPCLPVLALQGWYVDLDYNENLGSDASAACT
jgi:hypothetical protein